MNELYWISVIGKLNTVFWVGVGVSLTILFVASLGLFIFELDTEAEEERLSKTCKHCTIIALICALCAIMTPSSKELYLIYGAGTIVDYCKGDSKVKEIPDKAIDTFNRYLDSIKENEKGE